MAQHLPSRPNIDHLRRQAKTLLAALKNGDSAAARMLIEHLPAAAKLTPSKVRAAGFRLADAQSAVARKNGFDSWAALTKHVEQLRALEGEWHMVGLQVDGNDVQPGVTTGSRLLLDGDRFRMESPEAVYDGVFTIDASTEPMRIDIEFVEGPEAGNWSYGIYELNGDQLTICLGLAGASRPKRFATAPGTGHALERLRRASASRPENVTGGTRAVKAEPPAPESIQVDAKSFDVPVTALLEKLGGEWLPTELVTNGTPMPSEWLAFGTRTTVSNEMTVAFGGQVMGHAKMRIDERTTPFAVDYLNLSGAAKGKVSLGIMDWVGDEVRFLMAAPGLPRPTNFDVTGKGLTLSRWRRR